MTAAQDTRRDVAVHARVSAAAAAWLEDRAARAATGASVHQQARGELELWQAALAAELHGVRLTVAQASCAADVIGTSLLGEHVSRPGTVYAQCYDAFAIARRSPGGALSSYGSKHGIDEQELLDYLGSLGPAADHALADAISRWWRQDLEPTADGFAGVGLRVTEPR